MIIFLSTQVFLSFFPTGKDLSKTMEGLSVSPPKNQGTVQKRYSYCRASGIMHLLSANYELFFGELCDRIESCFLAKISQNQVLFSFPSCDWLYFFHGTCYIKN